MQITETRKAIIELIEPCMDKTLSEGCLIAHINNIYSSGDKFYIEEDKGDKFLYGIYTGRISYNEGFKIIGHYDITAVLKYIDIKKTPFQIEVILNLDNIKLISVPIDRSQPSNTYAIFPNKPLNLYTEEEDKNLLDLLSKLK